MQQSVRSAARFSLVRATACKGGQDHYAAYLANTDGFEVELVARET